MFLDKIVATKQQEVAALKSRISLSEMEQDIASLPACLGFEKALLSKGRNRSMGLIAEVKKASPSKGLIRADFDPVSLAQAYEAAGTDCISVLTDVDYFQGSNDYLSLVRRSVGVPILRKDFTIDLHQIYETRLIGADAILLIAAILTTSQMKEFSATAKRIGLDVLIEVHDKEELDRVLELDAPTLIGINNRNLKTFVTDLRTTEELIAHMPKGVTVVSESGISQPSEIAYLQSIGAEAVLIGEHFMRQPVVEQAVHDLMGLPAVKEL
ncbi:indole-3-glycerol phosphate synthase TrpC [Paenibacillus radicis (ex Xue et al. 2023)]|uniref:Indole-3-glycerol phosphate synthase n=1 Tax=Paenibacillus radicis (ex Xue et al. 2023) TaxID=2972489 RepID=A0ABT1YMR6_9BACL|nr:indole-3-glycerol phosphate synthase TrpC [Paenibacillus radicis (ex Xue et al. 2023)]MCR8634474.1 indole-3-glycerol phosphate synthase TrpC [Paenibacillus radicis (ex Xue et al. 2023)]